MWLMDQLRARVRVEGHQVQIPENRGGKGAQLTLTEIARLPKIQSHTH